MKDIRTILQVFSQEGIIIQEVSQGVVILITLLRVLEFCEKIRCQIPSTSYKKYNGMINSMFSLVNEDGQVIFYTGDEFFCVFLNHV